MVRIIRILLLLALPFLVMVGINEWARTHALRSSAKSKLTDRMNSGKPLPDKCSWYCHDHTQYCIEHHVKMNHWLLALSSVFYFRMIQILQLGGSYVFMNILMLVILIPGCISFMLSESFDLMLKRKRK